MTATHRRPQFSPHLGDHLRVGVESRSQSSQCLGSLGLRDRPEDCVAHRDQIVLDCMWQERWVILRVATHPTPFNSTLVRRWRHVHVVCE